MSIERPANVAMPLELVVVVLVPDRVAPAEVVMATVTERPARGTGVPAAVSTVTATLGVSAMPATAFVGWAVKTTLVGVITVTVLPLAAAAVQDRYFAVTV